MHRVLLDENLPVKLKYRLQVILNVTDNNYESILPMLEKIKQILSDESKFKLIVVS